MDNYYGEEALDSVIRYTFNRDNECLFESVWIPW